MAIKISKKSKHRQLAYLTESNAGVYMRADIDKKIFFKTTERNQIKTELFLASTGEDKAQGRPGSWLALKKEFTVLNQRGTIAANYRNELRIKLLNL
jgi:dUTPase